MKLLYVVDPFQKINHFFVFKAIHCKSPVMKNILLLSFFLLAFMVKIYAQENFIEGLIVSHDNDTIRGQIDYQNWEKNPSEIVFKSRNGSTNKYEPKDIMAFSVSEDFYESKIAVIDKSAHKLRDLEFKINPVIITDTVFLMALVKARASLYYLKDENLKTHYFIEKDSTEIKELIVNKDLKWIKYSKILVTTEKFKSQLMFYFSACPGIHKMINKAEYNAKSLVKIFKIYNNCSSSKIGYIKKEEGGSRYKLGIITGLSSTKIKFENFNNSAFKSLGNADFKRSYNFTFGLSLNFVIPRNRGRYRIYADLLYKSYKALGSYTDQYRIYDITFNMDYIKLTNLFRYQIPYDGLKPFINLGISNAHAINYDIFQVIQYRQGTPYPSEREALAYIREYNFGFVAGVGANYKKFSFEIRFERTTGLSFYSSLASKVNNGYFLFGYTF